MRALTLLLALLGACAVASALQFRRDGTFKIVQLTDLHFGEHDELDKMSQQVRDAAA